MVRRRSLPQWPLVHADGLPAFPIRSQPLSGFEQFSEPGTDLGQRFGRCHQLVRRSDRAIDDLIGDERSPVGGGCDRLEPRHRPGLGDIAARDLGHRIRMVVVLGELKNSRVRPLTIGNPQRRNRSESAGDDDPEVVEPSGSTEASAAGVMNACVTRSRRSSVASSSPPWIFGATTTMVAAPPTASTSSAPTRRTMTRNAVCANGRDVIPLAPFSTEAGQSGLRDDDTFRLTSGGRSAHVVDTHQCTEVDDNGDGPEFRCGRAIIEHHGVQILQPPQLDRAETGPVDEQMRYPFVGQ